MLLVNDLNCMDNNDYTEWDEDHNEDQNVVDFCQRLKEAWRLCPRFTLGEFLDLAVPASIYETSADEMVELLEEFIHQNQ